VIAQEAGNPHAPAKAELVNASFNRASQRTISHDDELEIVALLLQHRRRLDEQELTFLLRQSPDVDEPPSIRRGEPWPRPKSLVQTAVNDVDFSPILPRAPSIKLTPGELADGHDKSSVPNLVLQAERSGRVEFLGTVNRNTVGRTAQDATEKRDVGRVGTEVDMDMLSAAARQASAQYAGFGEIGKVPDQSTF